MFYTRTVSLHKAAIQERETLYVFSKSKDYKLNDLLSKCSVFLHWGYVEAAALQILTQQ